MGGCEDESDRSGCRHDLQPLKISSSAIATTTAAIEAPIQIRAFLFTSSFGFRFIAGGFLRAVLMAIILFSTNSKPIVTGFRYSRNRPIRDVSVSLGQTRLSFFC